MGTFRLVNIDIIATYQYVSKFISERDILLAIRPQKYPFLKLVSQDRLKSLFRLANVQANNKVFDKDLKSNTDLTPAFVLEFSSPTAKICFPKEDKKDLYLIQQFLVIQIFFFPGMSWTMELVISDLTKVQAHLFRQKEGSFCLLLLIKSKSSLSLWRLLVKALPKVCGTTLSSTYSAILRHLKDRASVLWTTSILQDTLSLSEYTLPVRN